VARDPQGAPAGFAEGGGAARAPSGSAVKLSLAWLAVGIPLAWGVWMTLSKAIVLFR
jgi:hypothetical protein